MEVKLEEYTVCDKLIFFHYLRTWTIFSRIHLAVLTLNLCTSIKV